MKTIFIAIGAIAALIVSPALAADMAIKSVPAPLPPLAPTYSWTSCYAGAGIGYGLADINHSTTDRSGVVFDAGHDNAAKGWLGMLGAGCDLQVYTRWVVGLTGDFDVSNIKGQYSFNCGGVCPGASAGFIGGIREPWAWGVGGRVGYLIGPPILTYWTVGFTQSRFDQVNYSDVQTGAATGLILPAQTYNGCYLGGGVEYAIGGDGLFWRTEYRFSDFQSRNVSQLCGGGTCGAAGTIHSIDRVHPQEQVIWTALVYRFNYWTGTKH
jgi:outer membrane immunogenic protein